MTEQKLRLPVGIENFERIITEDYYYVDKTGMIAELLRNSAMVTLFTRPRRFGKSLNMSMLEHFFAPDSDKSVFDGLKISGERELCEKYMGNYPVLSISLKDLEGGSCETAYRQMIQVINRTALKVYRQVMDSDRLLPMEKDNLSVLMSRDMGEADLFGSLKILSEILESHYGKKVIILIDEYDVPLAKAYEDGYYDQMVRMIRSLFHQALKTNNSLEFAVLTGCMRISKESIFTGLNNLEVQSISDEIYDEYFGFTDAEVRDMLEYYEKSEYFGKVKQWYDGYRFGETDVYCPWDVVCYCKKLVTESDHSPENYWVNSSANYAVRKFIACSRDTSLKGEIESLINGEAVEKTIRPDLTYEDMYASIDNIWSVLYTTGYLTKAGRSGSRIQLVIPNVEICNIFSEQILELFREDVRQDRDTLSVLCDALKNQNIEAIQESMNAYLRRTISIRDTAVRNSLKENFYHGILLGILSVNTDWLVLSNQESGNGYSDIQIRDERGSLGIVIEVKYADDGDLGRTCLEGLKQIEEKHYTDKLVDEEYRIILKYGMAFYRKECRVMSSGKV